VADKPTGHGKTMCLGGAIKVAPGGAATAGRPSLRGLDAHLVHGRKADHQPVLDRAEASEVVAATADRNLESAVATESQCASDVLGVRAPRDDGRLAVDSPVPD
jgi:hypothetical protein